MATMKMLPHDEESERAVLGAAMLDREAIFSVLHLVTPEDFYAGPHQLVFQAMCDLAFQSKAIDPITVKAELEKKGKLEQSGGIVSLLKLTDGMPRGTNVAHYAERVREKSLVRNLIRVCHATLAKAFEGDADPKLICDLETELFAIAERQFVTDAESAVDLAQRVYKQIEDRIETRGALTGINTGLPTLNNLTGGLQKSDLIVLAARPGMGKTTLAMNLAATASRSGCPTLTFSLEMSKEQLMQRVMCAEAGVEMQKARNGTLTKEDWEKLNNATARVTSWPMWIDDTSAIPIGQLMAKARRIALKNKIGLVVVDYLQLMTAGKDLRRSDNRVQEISIISRGLKALAKEIKVPVVALSQLNRAIETRAGGRPQLSDLRESGSIEQDADIVMFLHPQGNEQNAPENALSQSTNVELLISKHRNGPVGTVPLRWFRQWTRFEEAAIQPITEAA